MIFDTLKLAKNLQTTFTQDQAENLAEALSKSTQDHVATKGDLQILRGYVQDLKVELVRWIVTAIAFNIFATTGLILGLLRFVK